MPRYKVRSEGDQVRLGDQVLLEAIKTPGQYLHVSQKLYPVHVPEAGFFEVDVSSDKLRSSWAVRAHTLRTHYKSDKWLKACTFVRVRTNKLNLGLTESTQACRARMRLRAVIPSAWPTRRWTRT